MTWNTPLGHRVLDGAERFLLDCALYEMTMEILEDEEGESLTVGVEVFDSMTGGEQLVMMDEARKYLFELTPSSNPPTAVMEGTAGAIFSYIERFVEEELAAVRKLRNSPERKLFRKWRKLVYEACKELEWKFDPTKGMTQWRKAIRYLHEQILHDVRFTQVGVSDATSSQSESAESSSVVPDKYFDTPPMNVPDGESLLELIRRLLSS